MTVSRPTITLPTDFPATLTDAWQRRLDADPESACIQYFDRLLTAADVEAHIGALAAGLLAQGVRPSDRVAIMLQNIPQFPIAMFAIWRIGGIVVPLNPMYRSRELHTVLSSSSAVGIICAPDAVEVVAEAAPGTGLKWIRIADDGYFQSENDPRVFPERPAASADSASLCSTIPVSSVEHSFEEFLGVQPPPAVVDSEAIAMLSYTSGTTGPAKGAQTTHHAVLLVALTFHQWASLSPDDRLIALAPLFHITGSVMIGVAGMTSPLCLVLTNRPRPDVVLEAFTRYGVTLAIAPITMYTALLELPHASRDDFSTMRAFMTGGAPVPPAKVEAFEQRFGHYIVNSYGLTESNAAIVAVPPGLRAPVHEASGTLSIGVAMPSVEARVVDQQGHPLPAGEAGELELLSPTLSRGYWREPAATASTFPEGRLRTGDVAIIDDDGWIYLIDRIKDQINSSGYKVWPREVEDALYEHPAVREAAVVGEPDDYRGEAVVAYVSLRAGHTVSQQELVEFAHQRLAAYKSPRRVEFVDELPKTLTGKIMRRELRTPTAGSARPGD